jgi:hypothetical protein
MTKWFISLRDQLGGVVADLLHDEQMPCPFTQDGLVMLINALALYREEGRSLFPEVFIFDHLERILATLPGADHVQIGSGPKDTSTMAKALKRCAPLAQGGWGVYIHRGPTTFSYGLLRCSVHLLSVPLSELLVNKGDPQLPALMIRQIAQSVVNVTGVGGSSLLVYFGATRQANVSPIEALDSLATSIVVRVDDRIREQAYAFYVTLLSEVLRIGHGTLAVVQSAKRRVLPASLRDGIILDKPIKVSTLVSDLLAHGDCAANTSLQCAGSLVSGMLQSDGITVFGSDGSVRAYNVFIKHPRSSAKGTQVTGGARRRTFDALSSMIGKELDCVFMQSQDGAVDYRRQTHGQ